MKKLVLGSLITIAATSNVFAECTYNFDANQTQLNAISAQAIPFPHELGRFQEAIKCFQQAIHIKHM